MNKKKQALRAYNLIVIALLVIGAIYVCSRFIHFGSAYTDNAMVHRNVIPVNTRVSGFIKEIRFKEFQHVRKGDTLVIIDDAEFRLALAQAEANVKGSKAGSGAVNANLNTVQGNVSVAGAGMQVANAGISEAKVGMDNAQRDFERYTALLQKGAVTQQQYDLMKTQYYQARSRYEAARARLSQATASRQATSLVKSEQRQRLSQTSAGVSVAQAQLHLARLNLSYTVITAPCDGYMGRKTIHEGQLMQPGQMLSQIIDDSEVWVLANFRESQMPDVKMGATVEFTADALPDITFKGTVQSISHATGAAYSHIPVDNATGNFVKVEQRLPVRIELTKGNKAEDVKQLLNGMDVEVKVRK
ncbi:MAG: HlyD family secretion protein [Prevotella sp.]|nr:HlyD family secretion protein [Prevotella sp.]